MRLDFKSFSAKLTGTFILSDCNQLVRLAMIDKQYSVITLLLLSLRYQSKFSSCFVVVHTLPK